MSHGLIMAYTLFNIRCMKSDKGISLPLNIRVLPTLSLALCIAESKMFVWVSKLPMHHFKIHSIA